MAQDTVVPLASATTLKTGAFADLARAYDDHALTRIMVQATRACETETGRRLAPFSMTESHRGHGVDPDETNDAGGLPLDLVGTLGRSYAHALGASSMVRHVWLTQYAPLYPELWEYANLTVTVHRSFGGGETIPNAQIVGAENDTGHIWFQLGKFIPIGSLLRITYSGGYHTVPADLERACTYMGAAIIARELDPLGQRGQHPDALEALAVSWLHGYLRAH